MLISRWHSLPRQRTVEIDICQHCLRLSFQVNSWQGHSPPGWWQHAEKMRNYAEAGLTRLLLGPRHHLCSFSATCNKTCKLNCEWIAACSMQKYAGSHLFWLDHSCGLNMRWGFGASTHFPCRTGLKHAINEPSWPALMPKACASKWILLNSVYKCRSTNVQLPSTSSTSVAFLIWAVWQEVALKLSTAALSTEAE